MNECSDKKKETKLACKYLINQPKLTSLIILSTSPKPHQLKVCNESLKISLLGLTQLDQKHSYSTKRPEVIQ